jgi:hypothetical protein
LTARPWRGAKFGGPGLDDVINAIRTRLQNLKLG